jgi:ABC-type uncharacterized transport system fused permease/ATPase subunit
VVNAIVHRWIASVLGAAIYAHECREGSLRAAHMHVHARAGTIAAWAGGQAERIRIDEALDTALCAQLRMAILYSLQLFVTQARSHTLPSACNPLCRPHLEAMRRQRPC